VFAAVVAMLMQYSRTAAVFVLFHKTDRVSADKHEKVILRKSGVMEVCESTSVTFGGCFETSIYDESLYQAWSDMVQYLMPNRDLIR
jgi:Ras-related GTP-binding protein A/B